MGHEFLHQKRGSDFLMSALEDNGLKYNQWYAGYVVDIGYRPVLALMIRGSDDVVLHVAGSDFTQTMSVASFRKHLANGHRRDCTLTNHEVDCFIEARSQLKLAGFDLDTGEWTRKEGSAL
jgi:hypothetical protein